MTTYDGASFLSTNTPSEEEFKSSLESFLAETKTLLGGMTPIQLTISTDTLTPTRGAHPVEVESSTTDDLATIATTNLEEGRLLLLWPASTDKTITVKHQAGGVGQIHLRDDVDVDLDETNNFIMLQRQGEDWYETIFLDDFTSQTSLKRLEATGEGAKLSQTGDVLDLNQGMVRIDAEAGGADHTASGVVTTMTAGEDLLFGEVCYLKPDDGKLWKADAASLDKAPVFAMALEDIDVSVSASGSVLLSGFVRDDTWDWTVGSAVYLDSTAGALTQTAPTGSGRWVQPVGVATNADRIFFDLNRAFTQNEGELLQGYYPEGIAKSCLFVSGDSTYMAYTPSASADQTKMTFEFIIKRSVLGVQQQFFTTTLVSSTYIDFKSTDQLRLSVRNASGAGTISKTTTAKFRDTAQFYHIVVRLDSTEPTATDRSKVWVNGVLITDWDTDNCTVGQGDDLAFFGNQAHNFGRYDGGSAYADFYLARFTGCEGQDYSASEFGEDVNGIWCASDISGLNFGNDGFYLDFSDPSFATYGLGKDVSGNGNDWTPSGITSANQSTDTPTNNYCTLTPLNSGKPNDLKKGNLYVDGQTASHNSLQTGTFLMPEGKWYWELKLDTRGPDNGYPMMGVWEGQWDLMNKNLSAAGVAGSAANYVYPNSADSEKLYKYTGGSSTKVSDTVISAGDIFGMAFDADAGEMEVFINGVSEGTVYTGLTGPFMILFCGFDSDESMYFNFGSPPPGLTVSSSNTDGNGYGNFEYAPPEGFLALCSANMEEEEYVTSGTFTANANADGPFVYTGCYCPTVTIAGTDYVHGTDTEVDFLSNGFKLRTAGAPNASGIPAWSIDTADIDQDFKYANAQGN